MFDGKHLGLHCLVFCGRAHVPVCQSKVVLMFNQLKEVELFLNCNFEVLFLENMNLDKKIEKIDFILALYGQAKQMQVDMQSHERWSPVPMASYLVYGVGASEV